MKFIRSVIFNLVAVVWTFFLLFAYIPLLAFPRRTMLSAIRFWAFSIFWLQRSVIRLDFEFRGTSNLPDGPFILASAHQSAWDTIAFYAVLADPSFVLKKELYRVPMFGPYARRLDMIAIDRDGAAGEARRMIRGVIGRLDKGHPVVIFPGGTRSAPEDVVPLKSGINALYRRAGVPVVPVSLNSGFYWGRRSFTKQPGVMVAEFHEPIAPGLEAAVFDDLLSDRIHSGNRRLLAEAANSQA